MTVGSRLSRTRMLMSSLRSSKSSWLVWSFSCFTRGLWLFTAKQHNIPHQTLTTVIHRVLTLDRPYTNSMHWNVPQQEEQTLIWSIFTTFLPDLPYIHDHQKSFSCFVPLSPWMKVKFIQIVKVWLKEKSSHTHLDISWHYRGFVAVLVFANVL